MILPLKPSSSFVDFPPWLHESSIGILKKPWLRGRGQTGDPKYHIFKYVPNIPTSSDFAVPIIHTHKIQVTLIPVACGRTSVLPSARLFGG
jgi:hypothetical protein